MNIENRKFKMCYYTASHRQLLLRSEGIKNIDICFFDVQYIELPELMNNITIKEVTEEDREYIRERIGGIDNSQKITVLMYESKKYYVVSADVSIVENTLSYNELPFDVT